MKIFLIILTLMMTFVGEAYPYSDSQLEDCVSSAIKNPATKSIEIGSITNYCNCALKAIIDEKKDIRESGFVCAQQNFKLN